VEGIDLGAEEGRKRGGKGGGGRFTAETSCVDIVQTRGEEKRKMKNEAEQGERGYKGEG